MRSFHRLLGARRERRLRRRSADECDELAPSHCHPAGQDNGIVAADTSTLKPECLASAWGQKQRFDPFAATSGPLRLTDIPRPARLARLVPLLEVARLGFRISNPVS